jgi:hypothetical protein
MLIFDKAKRKNALYILQKIFELKINQHEHTDT